LEISKQAKQMKKAIVFGAGGFIGNHLIKRLKQENYFVKGIDLKYPEFENTQADEFIIGDLRDVNFVKRVIDDNTDELYQLAADMGGAGYIFTGENDGDIMHNSALINLNTVKECITKNVKKVFYASSACMYPEYNQLDPNSPKLAEHTAYPAEPDSEYGWEKLFSERLYLSFKRNYNLDIKIARFHNVYGPKGEFKGGKEKAPAAICRKVALAKENDHIEIWGDGLQTRSFLYIEDCIDGIFALMKSTKSGAYNIGSEEMVSINEFTKMIIEISNKKLYIKNIKGPVGVRGRCSDNTLVKKDLNWQPKYTLQKGIEITYNWVNKQVLKK